MKLDSAIVCLDEIVAELDKGDAGWGDDGAEFSAPERSHRLDTGGVECQVSEKETYGVDQSTPE